MSDIRERMQETARAIDAHLPPGTGFILLAFDFNTEGGRLEYISNAQRADVVKVMREWMEHSPQSFGQHLDLPPEAPRL